MKRRTSSDIMAQCIVDMVHEYKGTIDRLNDRIDVLKHKIDYWTLRTNRAVEQADGMSDKLGEIAEIIAGITEHGEDGSTKIYLSDLLPENESKLKRLFNLLDIPMTAEQIKDGDTDED